MAAALQAEVDLAGVDERKALLQDTEKQQTEQARTKMDGNKQLMSEPTYEEPISVEKFQLSGGRLDALQNGGSPLGSQELGSGLDNSTGLPCLQVTAPEEDTNPENEIEKQPVLLPQLNVCVYLRDQTVLHVTIEEGQHARSDDLMQIVLMEQKLPDSARDIFSLWLVSPLLELRLKSHHKPFVLVQQWDDLCDKYTDEDMEDIAKDEPILMFQRNVFYPRDLEVQVTDKEVLLYLYQEAKFNVLEARYIVSPEDYDTLAGLSALIHLGQYDPKTHMEALYRTNLEQFYPDFMHKKKWSFSIQGLWPKKTETEIHLRLEAAHQILSKRYRSRSTEEVLPELYKTYLKILYSYPFYGGAFFKGDIDRTSKLQFLRGFQDKLVYVSISTDGVCVIDREKNELLLAVPYESFSWQYKDPKKEDDPPILYLQFVCPESRQDSKLLIIDSHQAKLMDALIESCVTLKIQKRQMPSDATDSALPGPDEDSIDPFRKCTNKLDQLCLGTYPVQGEKLA